MHVNTNKIGSALVQTYKIYEQKRSIGEKERGATILLSTFRFGLSNYQIATFNCKPSSHQRLARAEPIETENGILQVPSL